MKKIKDTRAITVVTDAIAVECAIAFVTDAVAAVVASHSGNTMWNIRKYAWVKRVRFEICYCVRRPSRRCH